MASAKHPMQAKLYGPSKQPVHPYAAKVEVDNPVYKTHIVIEILSRELPEKIDDAMFAKDKLKEPIRK